MNKLSNNLKLNTTATGLGLEPQTLNNTNDNTGWISMENYEVAVCLCQAGAIAGGGALAWVLWQGIGSAGGTAKTTGFAATATTTAAHTDAEDNTMKLIEIRAAQMDVENLYTHIKVICTETGTQNAVVACTVVRGNSRYPGVLPA